MREYLGRHAAKHDRRNPASPVRGHDDEIAASLLGDVNDSLVRMILFDLHGFADDISCVRLFGDLIQCDVHRTEPLAVAGGTTTNPLR